MSAGNEKVEYVLSLKDLFTSGINKAVGSTEKLNASVNKTQQSLTGLGSSLRSAFAGIAIGYIAREVVQATATMEGLKNQLNFVAGNAVQGAKDLEYLRTTAKTLGLDLQVAAKSFVSLEAASRGTTLAGQGVKEIFEGVGMASTVMHLSAEQSEGAFYALQQMMSKGKVQAEELRGQLGERIPGAFQIAARTMGMTTVQLDKFMADGKLMADTFLPKFAAQLKLEFAGGMKQAGESLSVQLNLLNTAFFDLKTTLGELLMPVIKGTLNAMIGLGDYLKTLMLQFEKHRVFYTGLAAALGTLAGILLIYKAGLWAATAAQWLLNTATAFFAGLTGVGLFTIAAAGAAALAVGIYAASAAQENLNNELRQTKKIAGAKDAFMQTGKPGAQNTPAATTQTKSGGTSTATVESKGVQNFNIDINKLVEKIELHTTNMKEGATEIKRVVSQALLEAVNDFQLLATK